MKKTKNIIIALVVIFLAIGLWENFKPVNIKEDYNYEISNVDNINSKEFDEMIKKVEEGNYTKDNPYVETMFNDNLNAYIVFKDDSKTKYGYTVHGKEGTENTDFTYIQEQRNEKGTVVLPVIGLYENFDNKVDLIDEDNNVIKTLTIKTEKLKEEAPTLEVRSNEESVTNKYFENGFVLTANGELYDQLGDLRGTTPGTLTSEYNVFSNATKGEVLLNDIMGRNLQTIKLPKYNGTEYDSELHHDFSFDQEGNLYILSGGKDFGIYGSNGEDLSELKNKLSKIHEEDPNFTLESAIYKIDPEGNIIWTKTYDEFFDENLNQSQSIAARYDVDVAHFNSLKYYDVNGYELLLVSSRNHDGFMAIDPENGDVMWKFGSKNQVRENYDKYLDYDEATTPIPSGQHSARLLVEDEYKDYYRDGKLVVSVFNNNFCKGNEYLNYYVDRSKLPADGMNLSEDFCTVRNSEQDIYVVDPKNNTVEFLTSHPYVYDWSNYISNVFEIDNGMYFVHTGSAGSMIMYDDEGKEYFHADLIADAPRYRGFLVQEDELYEMLDLASIY